MILLDSLKETGKDLEEFSKMTQELEACTQKYKLDFATSSVLHLIKETDTTLYFKIFDEDSWAVSDKAALYAKKTIRLDKREIVKKAGTDFLDELRKNKMALMVLDDNKNKLLFISDSALKTLSARLPIGGKFLQEPTIERSIALGKILADSAAIMHAVIRETNGVRKMFAVFVMDTKLISMSDFLKRLQKDTAKILCRSWEITQRYFTITFIDQETSDFAMVNKFPFVPAFRVTVSTTGYCRASVKVFCFDEEEYFQIGCFKTEKYNDTLFEAFVQAKERMRTAISRYKEKEEVFQNQTQCFNSVEKLLSQEKGLVGISVKITNMFYKFAKEKSEKQYERCNIFRIFLEFLHYAPLHKYNEEYLQRARTAVGNIFCRIGGIEHEDNL